MDVKRRTIRLDSGLELAVMDWGGRGPLMLLHHATGMCAATWEPIATELAREARVIGFDARGHGDSAKPDAPISWQVYADDLRALARQLCQALNRERVDLVVGHSLGGIAAVIAMHDDPDLFAAAALLEPALITQEIVTENPVRRDGLTAASLATRMRQARFASVAEARACLPEQPVFAGWRSDVLDLFLAEGLEAVDGEPALKCPPVLEAKIYSLGTVEGLFDQDFVRAPLLLLSARESRFAAAHQLFSEKSLNAELETLDAGHMLPMQCPLEVAQRIRRWFGGIVPLAVDRS